MGFSCKVSGSTLIALWTGVNEYYWWSEGSLTNFDTEDRHSGTGVRRKVWQRKMSVVWWMYPGMSECQYLLSCWCFYDELSGHGAELDPLLSRWLGHDCHQHHYNHCRIPEGSQDMETNSTSVRADGGQERKHNELLILHPADVCL